MTRKDFNKRYMDEDLPWDIRRPDFNLKESIKQHRIKPGAGLDIGCGTGDNAMWLANKGFQMSGIDLSVKAIEIAKQRATENNLEIIYVAMDFLKDKLPVSFDFVFDRGCFHSFDNKKERLLYAKNVADLLNKDGLWLSLIGNYDDGRLDIGPPKRTAFEVTTAAEPYFEILSLSSGRFDSNDEVPSKIWICLMKKR